MKDTFEDWFEKYPGKNGPHDDYSPWGAKSLANAAWDHQQAKIDAITHQFGEEVTENQRLRIIIDKLEHRINKLEAEQMTEEKARKILGINGLDYETDGALYRVRAMEDYFPDELKAIAWWMENGA